MLDGIPLTFGELTPWGILTLVVIMLLTGRLIPRSTHADVIAQRDHWQGIASTALDVNVKHANTMNTQSEALRLQVEGSEMTAKIMQAIQDNAAAQKAGEAP